MRTSFFILLFCSLVLCQFANAANEKVPFKEVSLKVSAAFCRRMDDCSKDKIPVNNCIYEMDSVFVYNFAQLPTDKKVSLTQAELENCLKKVQSISCEQLKKSQKISGCEFLEKLSAQ